MRDIEDAYGHAMYDGFLGKIAINIVERDDGYIDVDQLGSACYLSEYKNWPDYYKRALKYASGRMLDVGCGAGRIALYFQNKGFHTTGIDISPLAIKTCRARGLKDARSMSISQVNSNLGKFDTIFMLGNNFGLFENERKAKWLLRRFRSITNPGAIIIAESNEYTQTTEPLHLWYHKYNKQRGRMPGQVRIRVRYKKYATPFFDYLLVTRREMEEIVRNTGWGIRMFVESNDSKYIAIIEKQDI